MSLQLGGVVFQIKEVQIRPPSYQLLNNILYIYNMAAPKGNKFAMGNNGGRPPKYKDGEELQKAIDRYFEECPDKRVVVAGEGTIEMPCYTITGLALYLGFESRQSLYDYGNRNEYSYIIKRSQTRVEQEYEKKLHDGSCTGAIFALKNMGWKDKTETEHSGKVDGNQNVVISYK